MKLKDILELLFLAALWGSSFLFMRIVAPVLGPIWLIEVRVLLAGLVLLTLVFKLNLVNFLKKYWIFLIFLGVINSAIPSCLYAFCSLYLSAGFTSILNATAPLFGVMIAAIWLKEKLTLTRMIGFALGFVGVVILIGWQPVTLTSNFFIAILAGLTGALFYAIAAPYIKQKLAGVPSLVIASGSQLGAAMVLLPMLPLTVPIEFPSITVIFAVITLALFSTTLTYLLYFRLIKNLESTQALTVTYLIPLFAMLWGNLFLAERITTSMVTGCGLILLGTAIANDLFTQFVKGNR